MRCFATIFLLNCCLALQAQPFRDEIQAFQHQDSLVPITPGQVLFVGSSSFRLWRDVQAYFPGTPIINRGFGGSCLTDMIYYEKQIITPYKPRKIVIYCGENDFAASDATTANDVFIRFKTLFKSIRADYPHTPIVYISMKPSPSRRTLMRKIASGNEMIEGYLRRKRHTAFVDVFHRMLDEQGEPRRELFLDDQLHMNQAGYQIWASALKAQILSKSP